MNDGGRPNDRYDHDHRNGADVFAFALARIAVAQLCESTGFQTAQGSAINTLTDVTARYACNVGRLARGFAESSGRSECNAVDVIQALSDLGSALGFVGASDVRRCVVSSGVLMDITHYLSSNESVPFSRRIPSFPFVPGRKDFLSFAQSDEVLVDAHVPNWLPVFPKPSAYERSSVEEREVRILEVEREERKEARSLLALRKWFAADGGGVIAVTEEGDFRKAKEAVEDGNPFLAPVLPFGAKEVSRMKFKDVVPSIKVADCVEAVMMSKEGLENGALDVMEVEKRVSPRLRPAVKFRLSSGKRDFAGKFSVDMEVFGNSHFQFTGFDEVNDKKPRNELVLRGSMEDQSEAGKLQDPL